MKKMDQIEGRTVPNYLAMDRIEQVTTIKKTYFMSKKPELLELALRFINTDCYIDKDRIFAFHGLSLAADENFLEPDYRMSTLEVFEAVAKRSLCSQNPFQILSIAGIGRVPVSHEHWPSWVPDWNVLSKTARPSLLHDYASYSAGGKSEMQLQVHSDDHFITLTGVLLDRVRTVATERHSMNFAKEVLAAMGEPGNDTMQKMLEIAGRSVKRHREALRIAEAEIPERYLTGETRWDATWRTLLCNRSTFRYPAEASCGDDYRAYFRYFELLPRMLQGDREEILKAKFALTDLPEDMQNLILQPEGSDKPTPDEIIDNVQEVMTASGFPEFDAREYLSPELLANQPRLMAELVELAGISGENASELLRMAQEPEDASHEVSPEGQRALLELGVRGHSTIGWENTENWELIIKKNCLMYGWIFKLGGAKMSDEKIAAVVELTRREEKAKDILYKKDFVLLLANTMSQRQFAVTEEGRLALVLPETEPGDIICVFLGAKTPHVLRRVDNSTAAESYRLVGEAYVHGFMDGEAVRDFVGRTKQFHIV
jgi:hypothetical protein